MKIQLSKNENGMKYISLPLQPQNARKTNTSFAFFSILIVLRFQKANGSVNEFHTGSVADSVT